MARPKNAMSHLGVANHPWVAVAGTTGQHRVDFRPSNNLSPLRGSDTELHPRFCLGPPPASPVLQMAGQGPRADYCTNSGLHGGPFMARQGPTVLVSGRRRRSHGRRFKHRPCEEKIQHHYPWRTQDSPSPRAFTAVTLVEPFPRGAPGWGTTSAKSLQAPRPGPRIVRTMAGTC